MPMRLADRAQRGRTRRASTSARPAGGAVVGRRYWPMVTMSTPTPRRSASAATHLVVGLAHADDERRLGGQPGRLGPGQHRQAAGVRRRRTHGPLQAGDRLEVVVQHVGPGGEDRRRARRGRPCSRGSAPRPRARACGAGWRAIGRGERAGAAVGEVVAGDRGDHRVAQAHALHGLGHPLGLVGVERHGVAGVDQAEPAGPGAALAVDHERGGAVGPALGDVRAARLLAHGDQLEVAHRALQAQVVLARCAPWPASTRACARRSRGPRRRPASARRPGADRRPSAPPSCRTGTSSGS